MASRILNTSEILNAVRDAERIAGTVVNEELKLEAFRQVLRELLDNEYVNDDND